MLFSAYFRSLSAAKKVALLAVFIALSIVVNCFSIDVTASNKIAFTYVVCFFAGYLLGGVPAFCIALLGDAIGYLVNPVGVYWLFGLTLGAETNSLILVSHSLKYPSSASTIVTNRIQVRDASHQSARIRDAVLPVLQYTGSLNDYREENTVFVVENLSPLSLDISEAEAGLDAATKTVWVSGLKYLPQGVILTIR